MKLRKIICVHFRELREKLTRYILYVSSLEGEKIN